MLKINPRCSQPPNRATRERCVSGVYVRFEAEFLFLARVLFIIFTEHALQKVRKAENKERRESINQKKRMKKTEER